MTRRAKRRNRWRPRSDAWHVLHFRITADCRKFSDDLAKMRAEVERFQRAVK